MHRTVSAVKFWLEVELSAGRGWALYAPDPCGEGSEFRLEADFSAWLGVLNEVGAYTGAGGRGVRCAGEPREGFGGELTWWAVSIAFDSQKAMEEFVLFALSATEVW